MKFYLVKVRLNSGGYTPSGYYFGGGVPLYYYEAVDTGDNAYIRASDRDDAKRRVQSRYPDAKFFN
jgi:hypothetical protein